MTRHPRVKILTAHTLLTAAALSVAFASGCQTQQQVGGGYGELTLGNNPHAGTGGRAGANSEAIFDTPESRQYAALYGRDNLPESTRLDGRMNIYDPQPMLATAQWPQEPQLDATRVYYTYLPVSTSSSSQIIPVYLREHQWGGYRRPSYYP